MSSGQTQSLDHALALAARGMLCFPCDMNKRPITARGFKDATADPQQIQQTWPNRRDVLVGVPTGSVSGLDVLDIDQRNGGASWFAEQRGRLPLTHVHRTRSGGLHLFFVHQTGVRCSASKVAPGVDVRACGGYVIWWPAAGLPTLSDMPAAAWPSWLIDPLVVSAPSRRSSPRVPDNALLSGLVRAVAMAHPGKRNSLTYWAGCRAGEMVLSGLLAADLATEIIVEAATRAGLPAAEARRTARSGIRKTGGLRHA